MWQETEQDPSSALMAKTLQGNNIWPQFLKTALLTVPTFLAYRFQQVTTLLRHFPCFLQPIRWNPNCSSSLMVSQINLSRFIPYHFPSRNSLFYFACLCLFSCHSFQLDCFSLVLSSKNMYFSPQSHMSVLIRKVSTKTGRTNHTHMSTDTVVLSLT